jgi:transposase InsO family protein
MDFTQKRIGNGDTGYVFGLLDMYNDAFVALTGHPDKNGEIVAKNLEILKTIQPQNQKIEIRSDCGKEFYNEAVRNFCSKNNIRLHFIPKGSPWLQAFIERGFRTIKEEFLNLVWIGNWNKFNDVLRDARYGYNHRPNSAFDYKNPLEVMAIKIPNLPQQVCGH